MARRLFWKIFLGVKKHGESYDAFKVFLFYFIAIPGLILNLSILILQKLQCQALSLLTR